MSRKCFLVLITVLRCGPSPALITTSTKGTQRPGENSPLSLSHEYGTSPYTSTAIRSSLEEYFSSLPPMPSPLFTSLAQSQMELLATSVSRIKSVYLYLPQENSETGRLEFLPAIIHPHSERVFIARDANSGEAPVLPQTLSQLPGFQHAESLLPDYPMISSNSPGVGTVEEIMCDPASKNSALSVPLLQGIQTVGVLLIWSKLTISVHWSVEEKEQISRAAQSLSLALSMDRERNILQKQSEVLKTQLSDALHQIKNPVQALRTYGKLLQQRLADTDNQQMKGNSPQLLELAKHLMVQSDRVVDLLSPFDTIVASLPAAKKPLALNPYRAPASSQQTALIQIDKEQKPKMEKKYDNTDLVTGNNGTIEFSNGTIEFTSTRNFDDIDDIRDKTMGSNIQSDREEKHSVITSGETLDMGFVSDVLSPILEAGKAIAFEKGIDFQLSVSEDLPGVWLRPKALQEAVANLLDNALKYVVLGHSSNPSIRVVIDELPTPEQGVSVRISDNGPGVPPIEKEKIFARGYRGERTSTIDGTGIGLDITRSMVSSMGGNINLANASDEGSTFEILLFRGNRSI
mmetsp:Transcript_4656/g.6745  ORF Transcript_4656/g.6745 Transcript_4656/m.6745 type:complete len:575 (+) Transcript_4656:63-1787(+)